ncbi:MAG: hypothetical protein ACRDS0_22750 [Pseudonocardiaceae bacterium]
MVEEAASQLDPHGGRDMGEIKPSGDPRSMQADSQWIKTFVAATQHQLPQELGTNDVPGVFRSFQLLNGKIAALDHAAGSQGINEREFSR